VPEIFHGPDVAAVDAREILVVDASVLTGERRLALWDVLAPAGTFADLAWRKGTVGEPP